jgi:hypothetical protein
MEAVEKSELRLGLVLYGGVSLAVYIYGVVFEVQRLLKASALHQGRSTPGADPSPTYLEALRDAGLSGAVVDLISGTSAGGINGILLAKAISAGADVGEVEDLWLEGGDIGSLLNSVDDAEPGSLLSSEVFEQRLSSGFQRLEEAGGEADPDAALDLFVSTTNLHGDRRRFMDAFGEEITTLVHRFVVQLKLRPRYDRDDFSGDAVSPGAHPNARLVKLARATSAFPVAFEPVRIEAGDELLAPQRRLNGWFADGGILNNKPFTEALQTIFSRSAEDGPVRRWLLSVDPDPKALPGGGDVAPRPSFDQIAVDAVAGIPRYQSLAADLESLESHNATVRQLAKAILDLEAAIGPGERPRALFYPDLRPVYRNLRQRAWAKEIADQLLLAVRPSSPDEFDPETVRAGFVEAALQWIRSREPDVEAVAVQADLAFQRRRIYYLIKLIGMAVEPSPDTAPGRLAAARATLWKAFESISQALWDGLASARVDLGAEPGEAFALARSLVTDGWGTLASTGAAVEEMVQASLEGVFVDLPAGVDGGLEGPGTHSVNLLELFVEFWPRDSFLLSVDAGGGARFRDIVDHAQISPKTAVATGVPAAMKLAGDTAGHFGGFLKRSWRQNDILWGRLDGAEILLRAILVDSTGEDRDKAIEAVCVEILAEACPAALRTDDGDWRRYLSDTAIGDAGLRELDPDRRNGLGIRAAVILRGMVRRANHDAAAAGGSGFRAKALGAIEGIIELLHTALFPLRIFYGRRLRKLARKTEEAEPDQD